MKKAQRLREKPGEKVLGWLNLGASNNILSWLRWQLYLRFLKMYVCDVYVLVCEFVCACVCDVLVYVWVCACV